MTTFKVGDMVVPKNKEEEKAIRRQISFYDEYPPPWKVTCQEGTEKHHLLYMNNGREIISFLHWRFVPAVVADKSLEDYL